MAKYADGIIIKLLAGYILHLYKIVLLNLVYIC
jgi:hypothetical protein